MARAVDRVRASRDRALARRLLALIVLVPAVAGTGCGSSDNGVASKSATEILAATRAAARSASSVRLTVRSSVGKAKNTLDAALAEDQGRARSSFLGKSFEVIRAGDIIYIKGNRAFNAQLEGALGVKVPSGVWLKGSESGPLAQFRSIVNIKYEVPLILGGQGLVAKGSTTKVGGQPAIELKQEHKLFAGTLYVATTGQPYPLKLIKSPKKTGFSESGQTTFTGWNDPVTISPPTNAIDISQLQHLKGR